ncbi:hypothetical protein [Halorussus salinus]|uniref:hypothetical protein n=1 Tax=Halorussus salinus TaxID=1364935 RepID=UPI0010918F7B|nr:hypothetical protein [Halorussus salinus]
MRSTGAHIDTERASGGEHGPDTPGSSVRDPAPSGPRAGEYDRLMQTPASALTAADVRRLSELRERAVESGDDTRVEAIDEQLGAFLELLDLPTDSSVEAELETLEPSVPSRSERVALTVVGLSCGAGIGFVMSGPDGVLAGALLGYVLVSQVRAPEVPQRD